MRMIPIKTTFMKMIRLVRDLFRKSGKDINLAMVGEDTKIDRNVVDTLLGKDEYGIKDPGSNLEGGKSITGGAILADGRVGLILNIQGLFEIASNNRMGHRFRVIAGLE